MAVFGSEFFIGLVVLRLIFIVRVALTIGSYTTLCLTNCRIFVQ
jgi:hypothetical protein